MANIGKLAVQIVANAQPMVQALQRAHQAVSSAGSKMASAVSAVGQKTVAAATSMTSLAVSAIAVAAPLAVVAGAALFAFTTFKSGIENISRLDMQARSLGVSITEMRTLMLAAGPAADSMGEAITHLVSKLTDAKAGNLDATRSFERLAALSGQPFAKGFAGGPVLESTREILVRLASIENAAARAAVGFDLFGGAWAKIAPEFGRGAEGLERAQQIIERFGLGVGAKDLESVRQVAQAWRELSLLWEGIKTQFTLAVAPIVAELAKMFDPKSINISGWKTAILDAIEAVAKAVAGVVDLFGNTKGMEAVWQAAMKGMEAAALTLVNTIKQEFDLLGQNPIARRLILGQTGDAAYTALGAASQAETAARIAQLQKEAQTILGGAGGGFGGGAASGWINDFFKRVRAGSGGTTATPANAPNMAAVNRTLEQFKGLLDSTRSPMESYRETLRQIDQMEKAGLFVGQAGMKERFLAKAFTDFSSAQQLPGYQGTAAAIKGSREAYSSIATFEGAGLIRRQSVQEQLRALQEEANRTLNEQLRIGREAAAALKNLNEKLEPRGI